MGRILWMAFLVWGGPFLSGGRTLHAVAQTGTQNSTTPAKPEDLSVAEVQSFKDRLGCAGAGKVTPEDIRPFCYGLDAFLRGGTVKATQGKLLGMSVFSGAPGHPVEADYLLISPGKFRYAAITPTGPDDKKLIDAHIARLRATGIADRTDDLSQYVKSLQEELHAAQTVGASTVFRANNWIYLRQDANQITVIEFGDRLGEFYVGVFDTGNDVSK